MYNFGNVHISSTSSEKVLEDIERRLRNKQKTTLFFTNAHCYNVAQKDPDYRQILNNADFNLNDGIGMEMGGKLIGVHFEDNLNGTDLTPKILRLAKKRGYRIFLLGGEPGVAEQAKINLIDLIPSLDIVGCNDGYFENSNLILKRINDSNADIVIVGMGVPFQEKWIDEHFHKIKASLFMGVGAFLDFSAGKVSRAPLVVQKFRMEWFYRMLIEPRRMWKRYLIGNLIFFYNVLNNRRN